MGKEFFKIENGMSEIKKWWLSLQEEKGNRAELKRCNELSEVFFNPAFYRLYYSLRISDKQFFNRERLALIAGLLSHIKDDKMEGGDRAGAFAKSMSEMKSGSGTPVISELRFRRLLKTRNVDDLYHPLIRIIRQLDGKVNVNGLVKSIYYWSDTVKKEWAFEYFSNVK